MFDAKSIGEVIGSSAFAEIQKSSLPKLEVMTLLQIWSSSSPTELRDMALAGELTRNLKNLYGSSLEEACDLRMSSPHLTAAECLVAAGIPLILQRSDAAKGGR